jgi:hypothetical protein
MAVSSLWRPWARGAWRPPRLKPWAAGAGRLALAVLLGAAYWSSVTQRSSYLSAILRLAADEHAVGETLQDARTFAVRFEAGQASAPAGYLLTIRAGARPGILRCEHARHDPEGRMRSSAYQTRHQLHAGREQYFFVSCVHWANQGDARDYACTVRVAGDAAIVASTRLDLSQWRRLPFSTVFYEGESRPGSPVVAGLPTEHTPDARGLEDF